MLSGDQPELAFAELKGALHGESADLVHRDGRLALISGPRPERVFLRMGYAKMASLLITLGDIGSVKEAISSYELPEGSYAVRAHRYSNFEGDRLSVERDVGRVVGESRGIDLEEPDNILDIYLGERVYAGLRVRDTRALSEREPFKRPYFSPVTLHPRMARALVNLTGISPGQALMDPFCGTGAVLMEAAMMGISAIGIDLDPSMIEGAKRNLSHYGLTAELHVGDIEAIREMEGMDAISTDPPYGRSSTTNKEPVESLYRRFFSASADALDRGKRLSMILPSEDYIELADDFRVVEKHSVKVHRSLTRHFYLLERL